METIDEKWFRDQCRKELSKLMEETYWPKIKIISEHRFEEIELIYRDKVNEIIEEAAKKYFSQKQKELAETLTKVIELLAIK